jgi:dephospho-CoA kinase
VKRIGLTGSIGSGKSTVSALLRAQGIPVLDADAVSRSVSSSDEVRAEVVRMFGPEFVLETGLNRPALAKLVFDDPEARAALNAIIHPRVRVAMARQQAELEASGAALVVQDIPLLFENDLQTLFEATILVDTPLETRIQRVMARDGVTREAVLARDAAQMPSTRKRELATYVLENDGDVGRLEAELEAVLKDLNLLR